jgi:uncharacterized phage protein (TIGR01671 family)
MREILFRGKRIDNDEWIEGHYGEYMLMSGESIPCISIPNKEAVCGSTCYDVEASTVGQFTGLTDKNGKKIFEGDIVAIPTIKKNRVVRFDEGGFCIEELFLQYYHCFGKMIVEVIGNIHDNPELLEADK